MHFSMPPPSENLARLRAKMHARPAFAGVRSELETWEVSFCEDILTFARTFYERF